MEMLAAVAMLAPILAAKQTTAQTHHIITLAQVIGEAHIIPIGH
jgi:hypothetical protein